MSTFVQLLRRAAFSLCLAAVIVVPVAAGPRLEVSQPWIRQAPPAAPVMAGYATLVNRGDAELAIVGAVSDAFGRVEVHEMRSDAGVMRMRPVPRLALPAGAAVALQPGGLHLMLMRPARALAAGDRVELGFELSDGSVVPVAFEVRAQAPD